MLVVSMIIKPQPEPGTSQGAPRTGKREATREEHAWTSTGTRPAKAPRAESKNAGFPLFVPKAPRVGGKSLVFRRKGAELENR